MTERTRMVAQYGCGPLGRSMTQWGSNGLVAMGDCEGCWIVYFECGAGVIDNKEPLDDGYELFQGG